MGQKKRYMPPETIHDQIIQGHGGKVKEETNISGSTETQEGGGSERKVIQTEIQPDHITGNVEASGDFSLMKEKGNIVAPPPFSPFPLKR